MPEQQLSWIWMFIVVPAIFGTTIGLAGFVIFYHMAERRYRK